MKLLLISFIFILAMVANTVAAAELTPQQREMVQKITGEKPEDLPEVQVDLILQSLTCYGGGTPEVHIKDDGSFTVECHQTKRPKPE